MVSGLTLFTHWVNDSCLLGCTVGISMLINSVRNKNTFYITPNDQRIMWFSRVLLGHLQKKPASVETLVGIDPWQPNTNPWSNKISYKRFWELCKLNKLTLLTRNWWEFSWARSNLAITVSSRATFTVKHIKHGSEYRNHVCINLWKGFVTLRYLVFYTYIIIIHVTRSHV